MSISIYRPGPAPEQLLICGGWDSKRPVPPEVARTLFGFLVARDGEGREVDLSEFIGKKFVIAGADGRRLYLEEAQPAARKGAKA